MIYIASRIIPCAQRQHIHNNTFVPEHRCAGSYPFAALSLHTLSPYELAPYHHLPSVLHTLWHLPVHLILHRRFDICQHHRPTEPPRQANRTRSLVLFRCTAVRRRATTTNPARPRRCTTERSPARLAACDHRGRRRKRTQRRRHLLPPPTKLRHKRKHPQHTTSQHTTATGRGDRQPARLAHRDWLPLCKRQRHFIRSYISATVPRPRQ